MPSLHRCARSCAPVAMAAALLGARPAIAQVPECGAAGRHYDPGESLSAPIGPGSVYYVDGANGNDSSDGRSEATAFRTIGRAVNGSGAPIGPGSTVRIKAGLYREDLFVTRSGTATDRIVIGAYGNGEVIVDASTAVGGWTPVSGPVYRARPGFRPTAVVVDGVPLFPEFSQAAVVPGRWYYDSSTGDLYLAVPDGANPAARDVGVVKDDEYEVGVLLQGAANVTLYGITVRFSGGAGISVLGDNVRVEKCRTVFNGKSGINLFGYQTIRTDGAQVIKNYVFHNMLRNWPRGRYKWCCWSPGVGSNGTPNALYQGNLVARNGGEGLLAYAGSGGTVIRDNIVYDNWSVNIYVDNQPDVVVENNYIYSHQPDVGDLYNNGDTNPTDNTNLKRLRPEGIMTADEDYGIGANLRNVSIANNVIVDCRRGITHYGAVAGSGLKEVRVLHNTITVPATRIAGESLVTGITIPYNGGNNIASVYRNNVVRASDPSTFTLYSDDAPGSGDRFPGLTLDHNLWFHSGRTKPFHWGPTFDPAYDYTLAEWLALPGAPHGAGDLYADPRLSVPGPTLDAQDKWPAAGSPAINAGASGVMPLDYDFCPRPVSSLPEPGAFEWHEGFVDVALVHPFHTFIDTLVANGVTSGCTAVPPRYCPNLSVTRAQMAVFLLVSREGSGYSPPACTSPVFNDVPCSDPFAKWVNELARRGITGGCGTGNYCPLSGVTRAQMSAFLLLTKEGAAYSPPACTAPVFNDVPCSHPFSRWINELARRGVTGGCGGGSFCPDAVVGRGQMAVFLVTMFGLAAM